MDPQTMIIGAAIVVVSAVVLYLISVCTMKEKTFEEVMEEQRQRQMVEVQQAKANKSDKLKRRYKKNKSAPSSGEEESPKAGAPTVAVGVEDASSKRRESKTEKMVELELEPEIIQPVEETKTAAKPKKLKKEKPAKAILHNKEEKVRIQKSEAAPETFHASRGEKVVKDELELKHEREKILKKAEEMEREKKEKEDREKREKEQKRRKEAKAAEEKSVRVEEVMKVEAQQVQAAAPQGKKHKKIKDAEPDVQAVTKAVDLVMSIQMAPLTDSEIQNIIEILLNKQGRGSTPAQWTKKSKNGDPLSLLKKQLEDKERTLQEEQRSAEKAGSRLKEFKGEFAAEKQKFEMVQKQSQVKIERQMEEIKALHARMQQTHEGHMEETNALKYQIEQYKNAANQGPLIQRLTEENKQLKEAMANNQHAVHNSPEVNSLRQQVSIMNDELARNVMNLNKSEGAKKNLEAKLAQYEERLRSMDGQMEKETLLNRKLNEVSDALRQAEGRNKNLSDELKSAHNTRQELTNMSNTISSLQAEKSHNQTVMKQLESKLQSVEQMKAETDNRCKGIEVKFAQVEKQNKEKDHELKMLKDENNTLSAELKTTKERTAGEGEESPVEAAVVEAKQATVGSAAPNLTNGDYKANNELQGELQQKAKELDELRKEIDAQKEKNNVLREKNWKAMEALKQAEKQAESASAKDAQIETLNKQLEEAKKNTDAKSAGDKSSEDMNNLQKSLLAKDAELCKIRQEINEIKKENTELRTGCEKATASLSNSTEEIASVQEQLKSSVSQVTSLQSQLQDKQKQITSLESKCAELETTAAEAMSIQPVNVNTVSAAPPAKSADSAGSAHSKTVIHGSTVVTRVQEKSTFDVSRLIADLDARDGELAILRAVLSQKESQLQELQKAQSVGARSVSRTVSMSSDISVEEVEHKDNEIVKLREIVKDYWLRIESLRDEVETLEEKMEKSSGAQSSAAPADDAKNSQLEEKIRELEGSLQFEEQKLSSMEKHHRDTLQSMFPHIRVSKALAHKEWLSAFEKEVAEYIGDLSAPSDSSPKKQSDLAQSEDGQSVVQLQSQITHYQTVLSDTENILHKLQESVEGEESKWAEKVRHQEAELSKAKELIKTLQDQQQSAQDNVSIPSLNGTTDVADLKSKLAKTEKQLEKEIAANKQLTQKMAQFGIHS